MQVKDEKLNAKIIQVAKQEFKKKGYQEVTLRGIAKKAGVTTGAIYTRYQNKESLFHSLCEDALKMIDEYFDISKYEKSTVVEGLQNLDMMKMSFNYHYRLIMEHAEAFYLLLFRAQGSQYDNYRETIIQSYVKGFPLFLFSFCHPIAFEGKSGEMLLRTLASCYATYIEEIVMHRPEGEELEKYVDKMAVFIFSALQPFLKETF